MSSLRIVISGLLATAALLLPAASPASAGPPGAYRATATLDGRTALDVSNHAYPDLFPVGSALRVICQARGPVAYGSPVWDVVATAKRSQAAGRPVAVVDRYVKTGYTGFSPRLRRCKPSDLSALTAPRREQPSAAREPAGLRPPPPDDVPAFRAYLGWTEKYWCQRNSASHMDGGEVSVDPNFRNSPWTVVRTTTAALGDARTETLQQRGVQRARVTWYCTNRAWDGSVRNEYTLYRIYSPTQYVFRLNYILRVRSDHGIAGTPLPGAHRKWTLGNGFSPE